MILCTLTAPLSALASTADEPQWTLNMRNAELRDLVNEVATITGKTMVLDPRLSGKVTVQSSHPMNRQDIYALFQTALRSQGFVALDQGERILILTAADAKTKAPTPRATGREDFVTEVIELHSAIASEVAGVLRPLVAADAYLAPSVTANAVIVSDNASNVQRIRQLLEEIDNAGAKSVTTLTLKHAWAAGLAKTLNESIVQASSPTLQAKAVADTRSNSLILIGPAPLRRQMQRLAQRLDVSGNTQDSARVRRLQHSDAKELAELLNGIGKRLDSGSRGSETQSTDSTMLISADQSQNALVLMSSPAQMALLESLISELDQPRAQVLVEAAIVEVSGDISEALGVQWAGQSGQVAGATNLGGNGMSIGTLLDALDSAKPPAISDGSIIGIGSRQFSVLINALSSDSKNNLLSTPSLLTLDNEQAEILVGQNVPFQTGSYTTASTGASNPFTTVERKDVGVTLKVTPHINEGNNLRLQVEQESSELAAAPAGVNTRDVITNKRSVKSTILANDGQIIVLGGLIKDNVKTQVSKVPLLGDIPWLGRLFTSTREVNEKTNLMVFLRPTLLRTSAQVKALSQQKYDRLRSHTPTSDQKLPSRPHQLFDGPPAAEHSLIDVRPSREAPQP